MEVAGLPETKLIRKSLYGVTICIINLYNLYLNSDTQQLGTFWRHQNDRVVNEKIDLNKVASLKI